MAAASCLTALDSPPPSPSKALTLVPTDLRLFAGFRRGDAAACRTVESWIRDALRRNPFGARADDVEDLVQETLISLWRVCRRDGFRLRQGLRALTRTVVRARCIDRLRRCRWMVELDEALPDSRLGPEASAMRTVEWQRIDAALARLDAPSRELLRLHFLEGLSYREIAQRVGRAEATQRVRMFQCMKQLRRLLATPEVAQAG